MEQLSLKLEVFEGPLDLLMHLIRKNKVNIYDIPIAQITNQYLEYLKDMTVMNLEIASEFVAMAARLLYIKSKILLPKYDDPDDDMEDDDPRKELVDKLLEYKKYKEISLYLKQQEDDYKNIFYKQPEEIELEKDTSNIINLSIYELLKAFNKVLTRNSKEEPDFQKDFKNIIKRKRISITIKSKEILLLLNKKGQLDFLDIFINIHNREEIVASFLAVLELIKLDKIIIQHKDFGGNISVQINNSAAGELYEH